MKNIAENLIHLYVSCGGELNFKTHCQGRREGGAGRHNDPGAHEGAHWLQEGRAREGAHRNDIEKLACEAVKTFILTGKTVKISVKIFFFLEITSFFGPNCSLFSVNFCLHKTGNPSYLSWPRAHVWL